VWQRVRKTLVFDSPDGKLRPDVSRVWLTRIQWDLIKTGGDDSNSEDDLRQKREGTVIEFLDETEAAFKNFTPHSYLIEQSKTADHEVYYSLLISISSFLVSSIWQDRTSTLDKRDEVTVEPGDKSIPGSLEAVEGKQRKLSLW
jgi:hypothetical protein